MKLLFCILLTFSSVIFSLTAHCRNVKDSAIQVVSNLSTAYKNGKLSEKAYLDTVHNTMRSLLSMDINFTNKELLEVLSVYREAIWNNKKNEEHKRKYYGILSNQAQMSGRGGEMLYYAKKFNDLEQKDKNQPSLTALTISTDYYNTTNSYDFTKSVYEKNKHFLLNIPAKASSEKMEVTQLVQATLLLGHIGQALYKLKDTIGGKEVEDLTEKIAQVAKNKYKLDDEGMANIYFAQILMVYERGNAKKSKALLNEVFRKLDALLNDIGTPEYLKPYIQFRIAEWKVVFFLNEKNIDSTAHYLEIFEKTYYKEAISYNSFVISKYKALELYNRGLFKESADMFQSAIKVLDSSRAGVVKDIDDMMYAQAEAEESQLMLTETEAKRKKIAEQLLLTSAIIALLIIAGLFIIQYIRKRQKVKFLEFKLNIARNIHDETSPALLYAKILAKSSRTEEKKSELEQHIEHTMELIRSLSHDLKSDKQLRLNDLVQYSEEMLKKLNTDSTFKYAIEKNINEKRFISFYQFSQLKAVINECITNTIKHATFRKINISFQMTGNKLTITYCDDGQGWDTGKKYSGIGMKNMEDRSSNLNGEWNVNSNYPKGYVIKISVLLR